MKLAFQVAFKNLMGAGIRTWLNVAILSFAYVVIILMNGIIDGWNEQAMLDTIDWEYGNGHLIYEKYDQGDPFSIQDGHSILEDADGKDLTPILLSQASIYPQGRLIPALLKGIDTDQNVIKLPTQLLEQSSAQIPVLIGKRMAKSLKMKEGDEVLLRWRDENGTFDASNITIAGVFDSNVPTIDNGQIWLSIDKLYEMTGLHDHATMFIAGESYKGEEFSEWNFKSKAELSQLLTDIIETKKVGTSVLYIFLMAIALLAIFDTQVLSVFRRQREIGTYIALGMTRQQVVGLFTVEGSMYSLLATVVGSIYGLPLFYSLQKIGFGIPEASQNMGLSIADRIYPVYSLGLILSTIALVVISSTIVSFLPARKISKMDPVDALKGKLQ